MHTAVRKLFGRTAYNQPPGLSTKNRRAHRALGPTRRPGSRVYYSETPRSERLNDITINKPLVKRQKLAEIGGIAEGDRVRHRIFGEGEVLAVRNMGADIMYEVVFDRVGTKKLMASYGKLEKVP